ncbi:MULTISPECIES: ABC transporter ATP-binding protein [unclassified Clostridium]|uniref:ABC transporter ATP-binding protein n=1 Tax=unclassified Clostridium TaxID=2614128 RepID=UPI0025BA5C6A|nr:MULTISPECIES: ABC transporter ATP-binding protein [unclassified Clostridium]
MNPNKVMKKNGRFYLSMALNMLEGLLSGCNFMMLYYSIQALWNHDLNIKLLLSLTGGLALVFTIRLISYSIGYTQGQIGGANVSRNIRLFLGDKIKKISLARFTKGQTGEYINVVTSNVNNYEKILTHKSGDIVKNIVLSLMVILFMGSVYSPVGLILLIANLMVIPALWLSFRAVKKYGSEKNQILADNVSNIVEYITGIQTFRAYGIGGTKNKAVTDSMRSYSNVSYVYEKKVIPIGVTFNIIAWCSLPATIIAAGNAWMSGILDTAAFLMVSMIPIFVSKLAGTIFIDCTSYKNLMISKGKITQIINEQEERKSDVIFTPKAHDICFEDVNFSYVEGEPILTGVNFTAEDKKLTAIVGDSGSGKSTILNLISKYYEPQAGDIKIGGISINDINSEKVLSQISMVDQDVFLFNDTIKNNIRYARPSATDAEIVEACKLANCTNFIEKLEKGYDTPVGENGNQISGGERQRISIARAILKNSPIILLDEATASLDIENELAVKEAILNLLKAKKTVIMIAHTLSIIKNADKILVVSNGKVIEQGTHSELIKKRGKYNAMWQAEEQIYRIKENA